jgi:hypothetical protein
MSLILEDFYSGKVVLPYLEERKENPFLLENVFPYRVVEQLEYEHIIDEFNYPTMAKFSAFGDEGVFIGRDGVKKFIEELRPIKLVRRLDGKLLINAKMMGSETPIIKRLFDDVGATYDGVRVRTEKMRADVATTGKLIVDENGQKFTVDYLMPDANKAEILDAAQKWSATATSDPIGDMVSWLRDLNFTPVGGMISKKCAAYIMDSVNVRKAIFGADLAAQVPTWAEVQNLLARKGLPILVINDSKYRDLDGTEKFFWKEDVMTWFGSGIGSTLMGPTEEGVLGKDIVRTQNGIYVQVYNQLKPPAMFTTASATSIIALPGVREMFIADVY